MLNLVMKKIFLATIVFFFFHSLIRAQSVGINTTTPHASAILDIKSSTKGMLIPRTSSASRIAIVNPAKGLVIYDTTTSSVWFHNGSTWSQITVGSNGWSLTGNTGINPANQFIGTTDEQPLRFRVNNTWAGEIHPTSYNVFLGLGAGQANTSGQANTAIGYHSLLVNTDGGANTASGYEALSGNTTGYNNTANGAYALYNNTVGHDNVALGGNALFANTTGNFNTAAGVGALLANNTANNNTATGYRSLYTNTTGSNNTANGFLALFSNNTGNNNTANGVQSLYLNTTGNGNTAAGRGSLYFNSTGNYNTANGFEALRDNSTGNYNTANGVYALALNTIGGNNTANGYQALALNTTGYDNTANGYFALQQNTSGGNNVASGSEALKNNTDGAFNTAVGYLSLNANTTGWFNTAIGDGALYSNVSGQRNTAIGYGAGTIAGTLSNTIGIGNDGSFLNAASNQVIVGNASTVFIGGKVNWGVISDARIKKAVEEDVKGLSFILKLRPVTYHISNKAITELTGSKDTTTFPGKYDGEKIKYTGFLAQEVEQAAKASHYDFSGYTKPASDREMYTIRYAEFVVPLVKAIQEQQLIIETLQKQVEAVKAEIPMQVGKQQSLIDELKNQLTEMKKEIELLKKKN
jgi:trimeric autotransporter adhesin